MEGTHKKDVFITLQLGQCPNKLLTLCLSDFVFRILQIKTGSGVAALVHSFTCSSELQWGVEGFTHLIMSTVLICIFWQRMECCTFFTQSGQLRRRTNLLCICPKPKLENYEYTIYIFLNKKVGHYLRAKKYILDT